MLTAQIAYASRTGNNEEMADIIHDCLVKDQVQVEEEEISTIKFNRFINANILVVCSYTYGQGRLPKEALAFHSALQKTMLAGKTFGIAGSGDKSFGKFFNQAVNCFNEAFQKAGATQGAPVVKIDLEPSEVDIERLNKFSQRLVQTAIYLSKKNKMLS